MMGLPAFSSLQILLATSVLVAGTYVYRKLHFRRRIASAHIPQLPRSFLWGHMIAFNDFMKKCPPNCHADRVIRDMHEAAGRPPLFLIDNWPIIPAMIVIANHDVAEQITRPTAHFPYGLVKSPSVERMSAIIGPKSILSKNEEEWKVVRKRFTPGFSPQYLLSLLPTILGKTEKYIEILDHLAKNGETFSMDYHTTNLTFDIIGAVTMGEEMDAQTLQPSEKGDIVRWMKEILVTFYDDKLTPPWWMIPRTHMKRMRLSRKINTELKSIVQRNFNNRHHETSKSILALSLRDLDNLTPDFMEETCDQLRTFLFAGHDTTSTLVNIAMYELSRTPRALQAVRDELIKLFGSEAVHEPDAIRERLLSPGGDSLIHQMPYISAVMKEVLRLYPPAGSVRAAKDGAGMVVKTDQGEYCLDGNWVYVNHYIIHRDPAVYGETANDFVPERWLERDSSQAASTWRPFERGPRNCIGLELANIEARAIIAMLACRYRFEKVGVGAVARDGNGEGTLNEQGQYLTESELYLTFQISGKPVDGMMMKVYRE